MKPAKTALVVTALAVASGVLAQQPTEADLAELREQIGRVERELEQRISRRDDGMAELMAIESSLAETRAGLASLADQIEAQTRRSAGIAEEQRAVNAALAEHEGALAEQIRMSYMTGSEELVKLLLSQESPADLGRMLVYYDYLNRHRGEQIAVASNELLRLRELAEESEAVASELERLRVAEAEEAERLETDRAERATLIAALDAEIESSGDRIERLRADEAELNELIARLAEVTAGFPVASDTPFSEQRGQLPWPVDGRLVAEFGDPRDSAGRIAWSGVLLEADAGTVVRAIYHGRVIHSQWIPEMGLLLILDHGEGFWSLYGHNAALLRDMGDWVAPGEPIAEVGDTGGRLGTGLFFAIRKDGEEVDPAEWIRR
jgi:septal ring factor EnvC (AmiA/AmiB activator)